MINMTLNQAAALMNGTLFHADPDAFFTGAAIDSRQILENMLFIPIVGARVDGHSFWAQICEKKAAAMLWQSDHGAVPEGVPAIVVDNCIEAMGKLASGWLAEIRPLTIGITGSNGKTSTKDFCASLFSARSKTWKTQGNHNNEIGLPLTILEAGRDTGVLILEMGMENRGEIAYLCSIAPLDVAVITSIGSAHLENLGSRASIARAKCEITTSLKPSGTFIWHNDGPEIRNAIEELDLDPSWSLIPYGPDTEYAPCDLHHTRSGLAFSLPALSEKPFLIHTASDVQALNATAALLAARAGHVPEKDWHEGLEKAELTPMRGDLHPFFNSCLVDDTYKSNPEAARAALQTLMEIPASCHIAVLADMFDLGEQQRQIHADLGTFASELGVDCLYTYGPLSQETYKAFLGEKKHFTDKQDLIDALIAASAHDAAILVKGSRAMKMDEVVRGCLERNSL